jgi:hypothetical protein
MRLKYFLRGVGIGILVTTIILTATHASERRMSDSEVIDRAIELGMSFSASHSGQQSGTEEASSDESSTGQETSGDDVTDDLQHDSETETEMGSQSPSETVSESTSDGEASPGKESEAVTGMTTQAITETTETTTELTTENNNASSAAGVMNNEVTCTINITKGMSSRTVCDMLKQNGIIEDAADFDRYLIKTGYDDKIRVGEVEVNSGMTYEELTASLYKK